MRQLESSPVLQRGTIALLLTIGGASHACSSSIEVGAATASSGETANSAGGTGGLSMNGGSGGIAGGDPSSGAGGGSLYGCGPWDEIPRTCPLACDRDDFCDFPLTVCGNYTGSSSPSCQPRPEVCPELLEPACGCDGVIYSNACEANAAGVDLSSIGTCVPPAGQFRCGPHFCDVSTEYCYMATPEGSGDATIECHPIPQDCAGDLSCSCLVANDTRAASGICNPCAPGELVVSVFAP